MPFTRELDFVGGPASPRVPLPCYQTIDAAGEEVEGVVAPHELGRELALRMYRTMVQLQAADTIFYEAQRQVCVGGWVGLGECQLFFFLQWVGGWYGGER